MKSRRFHSHTHSHTARRGGFALVLTLALIALAAVAVVSFLNTTQRDRRDAHALANLTRAATAAEDAAAMAQATLQSAFTQFPDSATAWDSFDQTADAQGTLLYYRPHPRSGTPPDQLTIQPETPLYRLPLCSGAVPGLAGVAGDDLLQLPHPALPFEHPDNSVDLNHARFPGDELGWIGSPSTGRRPVRVPWVEVANEEEVDRVVARYAWWIEDESFKLDLNRLGTAPRGQGPGSDPSEIPLQSLLDAALPAGRSNAVTQAIAALRERYPGRQFPEVRHLNHLEPELGDRLRYHLAPYTSTLNLSRTGVRRVNLNALVSSSRDPEEIRQQLDHLLAPIRQQLPRFGQRFYGAGDEVSPEHEEIYLQKLAANLRDHLAPDAQPTLVQADGTVLSGVAPTAALHPSADDNANPVIAIGKKNLPYLQEYAARITLLRFFPNKGSAAAAEFRFHFDHYFEFWNMGTRDLSVSAGDLGPNPFLLIHDLPGFDTGTGGTAVPAGRSARVPLPDDLVFPAGQVTVLTTDAEPNPLLIHDPERLVVLPRPASLTYEGVTRLKTTGGEFRVNLLPRSSATTDYETKVLLGNDHGLLESHCALPLARGQASGSLALQIHNNQQGTADDLITGSRRFQHLVRGGSLHGNTLHAMITGDPRTNNEQLHLRAYDSSGDAEQTRFYNSTLDNPASNGTLYVPAASTLGEHNFNYVNPLLWPDPFRPLASGVNAPAYVAQGPLRSIGELGHLFDPAREVGPSGNILYARGGGRTLAIGQPDPLLHQSGRSRADREQAAWRLTDVFSITDDLRLPGRVNLNGVLRDDGLALRALLHGFTFLNSHEGDPRLAAQPVPDELADQLATALAGRISLGAPLAERGELSELLDLPLSPTLERTDLYDRGREELFRRIVGLTTTRGSTFTLYALGQSLAQSPSGTRTVTATARLRVTFELIPVWDTPGGGDSPLQPPDRFQVKVLSSSGH